MQNKDIMYKALFKMKYYIFHIHSHKYTSYCIPIYVYMSVFPHVNMDLKENILQVKADCLY